MNLRILVVLMLSLFFDNLYAQKELSIAVNQRVILNFKESVVYADVLTNDNKIKVSDDLYYFWFSANDIKRTRGGFDGKLLHGNYTEFYLNKNLKEKGGFKYGLKNGEWKSWYLSGEIKEISKWKKGKQHGEYRLFNENGQLVEKGTYRNGLFNGKIYKYTSQNNVTFEKYKKGVLKKEKKKKAKFLFFKKKTKSTKEVRPSKNKGIESKKENVLEKKEVTDSAIYKPDSKRRTKSLNSKTSDDPDNTQIESDKQDSPLKKASPKKKEETIEEAKPKKKKNGKS